MQSAYSQIRAAVGGLRSVIRMVTNRRGLRRSMARGYVFDLSHLLTKEMLIDCGRERFYVATSDRGVGRELFTEKAFEAASFERIFELVAQQGYCVAGRVFLDVGANIGTTSVMAITRLGCSHVFAFEPSQTNVRLLRHNVLANGLDDLITPIRAAVSDRSGEVEMRLCETNSGDHRINRPEAPVMDGRDIVTVQAVSLDAWLDEQSIDVDAIGLVWIDAQGHEPHVLAGASQLLASGTPFVCEFWPHGLREARSLDRMCELLDTCGRTVIDLGHPAQAWNPRELGTDDLRSLAARYPGTNNFCDLLLLRS